MNFQIFKLDLEKAGGSRDKISNICWIIEKAREFQKNIYFCFIDYAKPLSVWITTNFGKLSCGHNRKRSVFIPIPKKGDAKECSNYSTIALISHTRKVMLKILQARLQQYMNHELPDIQAGFKKKAEEPEIKLQTSPGSLKNQESFRKTSISALLTMPKPLTVWITISYGKF